VKWRPTRAVTLLVGLGLTEFSNGTPGSICVAKKVLVLECCGSDDLRPLARRIRRLPTVDEIERELLSAAGVVDCNEPSECQVSGMTESE